MNKHAESFIAIVFFIAISALLFYSYYHVYRSGIKHAVEDSRITIESNEIFIDLDGQIYVHSAY